MTFMPPPDRTAQDRTCADRARRQQKTPATGAKNWTRSSPKPTAPSIFWPADAGNRCRSTTLKHSPICTAQFPQSATGAGPNTSHAISMAILVDTPLSGGLEPMLGRSPFADATVLGFLKRPARIAGRAQPSGFFLSLDHAVYRAG